MLSMLVGSFEVSVLFRMKSVSFLCLVLVSFAAQLPVAPSAGAGRKCPETQR